MTLNDPDVIVSIFGMVKFIFCVWLFMISYASSFLGSVGEARYILFLDVPDM